MLTGRRRVWLAGLAAMAVLGLLAAVSLASGHPGVNSVRAGSPGSGAGVDPLMQARLAAMRRMSGDPLALGPVNAPVLVAEWGDFQCPLCRAFAVDTEPALVRRYADSGRMRLEWHDLAYLGPESVLAARAARAAGRQHKFWEFHDALYRDQRPENSGALTETTLTATARSLRLNVEQFAGDLADPAIAAQVDRDQREGARLGITRVPSFLINGGLLFGPQPIATFDRAIDDALAGGH